jgi:hypothetical protein
MQYVRYFVGLRDRLKGIKRILPPVKKVAITHYIWLFS